MNYIKKLEKQVKTYEGHLQSLAKYINSDKFSWPENLVNVEDIKLRMREMNSALADIEFEEV